MAQLTRKQKQKFEAILNTEIEFAKQVHAEYGVRPAHPLNLLPDFVGIRRAMDNMPERNSIY